MNNTRVIYHDDGGRALTPAGVQPLWPLRDTTYTYAVARASNPIVNYALLDVGGGTAVLALGLGRAIT